MISLSTPFRFHIYCSLTPIWKPSSITTTCNSRELANEHPNRRDTLGKGPKVRQRAESQMLSEPKSHCSTQNLQATTFPNQPTCRKSFITQSRCDWSKQKSSSLGEYTSCISNIIYIYIVWIYIQTVNCRLYKAQKKQQHKVYLSSDVFPTPLRFEPIPKGHMLALLTRTHLEVVIEWNHPRNDQIEMTEEWRFFGWTVSLKKRKETCYKHTHIWISSRSENKQKKLLMFPKPMGFCPSPVKASQPLGFQACTTPVAEMVKCSPSFAAVDTVDSVPKGRCFASGHYKCWSLETTHQKIDLVVQYSFQPL